MLLDGDIDETEATQYVCPFPVQQHAFYAAFGREMKAQAYVTSSWSHIVIFSVQQHALSKACFGTGLKDAAATVGTGPHSPFKSMLYDRHALGRGIP